MDPLTLRIFISSPGDVAEERILAARVLERLQGEFGGRVILEPMLWEHEPLLASATWQVQIPQPARCDIVVCILWARLGTRLPEDIRRPDGSSYESGTAYEFEDALESHRQRGTPDLLVYRKTAIPTLDLTNEDDILERLGQKKALDQFIQKWFEDPVKRIGIAPYHPFADSAQFEQLMTVHLRKLVERRLPEVAARSSSAIVDDPTAAITWTAGSPFRGLEPFNPEHAAIFAGRTRVVGEVLQALRTQATAGHAFVLVIGASGAGKSSLVRAGVLPLLTQPGVIEGIGVWRYAILRPSDAGPALDEALAAALLRSEALPELAADGTTVEDLAAMIRESPLAAAALVKGALSQAAAEVARKDQLEHQPEARLALVVDQLEELFTQEGVTAEMRATFTEALRSLARSGRVFVVATLRSDLYHRTQELPALVELKSGVGLYDLLPASANEVAQMIRDPARAAGLRFEVDPGSGHGLDEDLRDAAASNPGNLALLEFTLDALYAQRTAAGLLTFDAYRAMGGLEGAIASHAEAVFSALKPETQGSFTRVFRHLVRVSGDAEDTVARQSARLSDLTATPAAGELVARFVDSRLLISDRGHDGEPVVTLAHEALLRHWPRLRAWLDEDRELLRIKSRVHAAAARWQAEGRRSDLLLPSGKPLEEAIPLMSPAVDIPAQVREYIELSHGKRAQKNRLRGLAVVGLGVLAVLFAVAAVMAFKANSRTRVALVAEAASRRETDEARLQGLAREAVLFAEKGRANTARDKLFEAFEGFPEGKAPAWFTWAIWDVYRRHRFPLAVYETNHSLESLGLFPGGEEALVADGEAGLQRIDLHSGRQLMQYPAEVPLHSAQTSRDGRVVAALGSDNALRAWDAASGELLRTIPSSEIVNDWTLSADGTLLIAGGQDKLVHAWELATGIDQGPYTGNEYVVNAVAISPDGRFILGGANAGSPKLRVWDRVSRKELHAFGTNAALQSVYAIDVSPDNKRAITWSADRSLRIWELATGTELNRIAHEPVSDHVRFLPDGQRAVTLAQDGVVRLWDLQSGTELTTWVGDPEPLLGLAIDAKSGHLITCDSGGQIALWSMGHAPDAVTLEGDSRVRGIAFDPSGRWVAAASEQHQLRIWDRATGKLLKSMEQSDRKGTALAFAPDGETIALGFPGGRIQLVDLDSWTVERELNADGWVAGLCFSADGQQLFAQTIRWGPHFANAQGGKLTAFDLATLERRWEGEADYSGEGTNWIDLAPDQQHLIKLTGDGRIQALDLSTGKVASELTGEGKLNALGTFSPSGKLFVVGTEDRQLNLWNWDNQSLLTTFSGQGPGFDGLGITPDERLLCSLGSGEDAIRVWDLIERSNLLTLPAESAALFTLAPDGKSLAVATPDESLLWQVQRASDHLDYHASLPGVRESLRKDPSDAMAWSQLGAWYAFNGDYGWALQAFERAGESAKIDPLLLGRCHWMAGNRAEAVLEFQKALASSTDDAERRYLTWCIDAINAQSR